MPDPAHQPIDYELPRELIAQEPLANRADARLMLVDRSSGELSHHHVRDLPDLLNRGDRLVMNDTRVLPATLVGERLATGGAWRGLFLSAEPGGDWTIVCKTRGKLKAPEAVSLWDQENRVAEKLWLLEKLGEGQWLARPESERPVDEVLARVGRVPLPHYIRGGRMVDSDLTHYQTIFARKPGAVAAPTAGLHFTEPLLRSLEKSGVEFAAVTLHVGLGTFRPIKQDAESHEMHAEWCEVTPSTVEAVHNTRAAGGRIVAVGTTTVRTLESASASGALEPHTGPTELFIRPPYDFRSVDALITNFHFPQTTLLLMVEALGGRDLIRRAYQEAIRERYRFYSYGDAMLVL